MSLEPCSNGLSNALQFLKEHESIRVPQKDARKFWSAVESLDGWGQDRAMSENDARKVIHTLAPNIQILIRPRVFEQQLVDDCDFADFSMQLLNSKATEAWSKLFSESPLSQERAKQDFKEHIQQLESNLKYWENRGEEITRSRKQELENLKRRIAGFDKQTEEMIKSAQADLERKKRDLEEAKAEGVKPFLDGESDPGEALFDGGDVARVAAKTLVETMQKFLAR